MASSENLVKTALNQWHRDLGGEMVPFAGYELPVLYKGDKAPNGGVMKEHLWCRSEGKSSLFDVSHMGQVRADLNCICWISLRWWRDEGETDDNSCTKLCFCCM